MSLLHRNLIKAIFLIAACASFNWAHAIIRCEMNGKSVNQSNGSELVGLTGMLRCTEQDTGKLQREQEMKNGKFIGLERMYAREGYLVRERSVNERGNTQGIEKEFWPSGKLRRESTHDNGTAVGAARSYHDNGQPERVSFVADSRVQASLSYNKDGALTELSCHSASVVPEDRKTCGFDGKVRTTTFATNRSNKLNAVHTYEQGKLLASTYYNEDGDVSLELAMKDGARWHRFYYAHGTKDGKKILREERLYEPSDDKKYRLSNDGGPLQWSKQWGTNEQLIEHIRYSKSNPVAIERWYLNGAIKEKIVAISVAEGNPFGGLGVRSLREQYDDTGRITSRENFVGTGNNRAQPVGLQQAFYPNGKIAVEETYSPLDDRSRSRLIARKEWDESGKLTADDEILEDGSRKRR
jgi:antitoxin component YwqK of YwqJK toxin-antitoxin module